MECATGEAVGALDLGHKRTIELAGSGNEKIRVDRLTGSRFQRPHRRTLVITCRGDRGTEADVRTDLIFVRAVVHVREDLVPRHPVRAPVGFLLERIAIIERAHVATSARVSVVAPRSAERAGLLVDREIVIPGEFQPVRKSEASETGTDNRNAWLLPGLLWSLFHGVSFDPRLLFASLYYSR